METTELVRQDTPQALIAQAIDKGLGVAELEKLLSLQERWEANQARKKFFEAFSKWQANQPDIRKTKEVKFKEGDLKPQYMFAPLAAITRQISKPLQEAELSYRWEITDTKEELSVTCIVSHIDGHSEKTTMRAEPDKSGSKNAIQARGATITYLQRYTLIGALGLSTADADLDANVPQEYEYDVDRLHGVFMEVYNQIIQLDPAKNKLHPDNWLIERTGKNYAKAIGDARKILFDLQNKKK